jgi:hypothetical protein
MADVRLDRAYEYRPVRFACPTETGRDGLELAGVPGLSARSMALNEGCLLGVDSRTLVQSLNVTCLGFRVWQSDT